MSGNSDFWSVATRWMYVLERLKGLDNGYLMVEKTRPLHSAFVIAKGK